jgi:5'-3' exonuclease
LRSVFSTAEEYRRAWHDARVSADDRMMVLDTASLYFRAFFGVPEVLADDGTPVNAVRGLLDFISRLVGQYRPTHLVCAWDNDWRPQWRVELVPSYKGHRVEYVVKGEHPYVEEVPDPLEIQVPIIEAVLAAFGICKLGKDGYEADDVIGSLAAQATMPVDVVTGDRDLFQVVDDERDVRVLYVARGVGNHERVTDHVVVEKYSVLPSQYADFATMRGDASDGLPGVPGVGEKTASALLLKYGDLRGIVAAAEDPASDMAPSPRKKIVAAADYLLVAPKVVEVVTDIDLGTFDATLPSEPSQPELLAAMAEKLNLEGPVNRLTGVLAG